MIFDLVADILGNIYMEMLYIKSHKILVLYAEVSCYLPVWILSKVWIKISFQLRYRKQFMFTGHKRGEGGITS
jgi:hypothetical protein